MSKTVHLIIEGLDSSYQGSIQGLFSWPTWRTVRLRMRWVWCLWSSLIRDQRKKAFMYVDLLMSKSLTMYLVTEGVTSCSPGWNAGPWQGYPQAFCYVFLMVTGTPFIPGQRETMGSKVSSLRKQQDAIGVQCITNNNLTHQYQTLEKDLSAFSAIFLSKDP